MLMLPPAVKIFISTKPADMRRSFDGLAAMVTEWMGKNPLSGHLFVFRNRTGDRVKIIFWDRSGYCLWYKRLEEGLFKFPADSEQDTSSVEVEACDLALLLEGIELAGSVRRKRFVPRESAASGS
jgi:transposase